MAIHKIGEFYGLYNLNSTKWSISKYDEVLKLEIRNFKIFQQKKSGLKNSYLFPKKLKIFFFSVTFKGLEKI